MNNQQIDEIVKVNEEFKRLRQINDEFLQGCTSNAESKEINARLEVTGSTIQIDCFDQIAKADCRFVRTWQGDLAAEYVFIITQSESRVEVWRCYVTERGKLAQDPSGQGPLCDHNNTYIAKHICVPVLLGALHSKVFATTESEGG